MWCLCCRWVEMLSEVVVAWQHNLARALNSALGGVKCQKVLRQAEQQVQSTLLRHWRGSMVVGHVDALRQKLHHAKKALFSSQRDQASLLQKQRLALQFLMRIHRQRAYTYQTRAIWQWKEGCRLNRILKAENLVAHLQCAQSELIIKQKLLLAMYTSSMQAGWMIKALWQWRAQSQSTTTLQMWSAHRVALQLLILLNQCGCRQRMLQCLAVWNCHTRGFIVANQAALAALVFGKSEDRLRDYDVAARMMRMRVTYILHERLILLVSYWKQSWLQGQLCEQHSWLQGQLCEQQWKMLESHMHRYVACMLCSKYVVCRKAGALTQ